METAHAQTDYQDNSTSGRGARASYQTMLPEISAEGSFAHESLYWLDFEILIFFLHYLI